MRLLPPGTLDGVSRVVLCLGAEYQREMAEAEERYAEPDPLLGRLGSEALPGVYVGERLGTYVWDDASVWLYAYVYDGRAMPDQEVRELYLRLQMLVTFVHEVAHHWDGTSCGARGRWAARPEYKSEWSAEKQAYGWTQRFVVPYLEQSYPAATRALVNWVAQHGGVALPLSKLVNHPDEWIFYTGGAVESLFEAVDRGEPLRETKIGFARDLHLAERFDEALQSLAVVLADHPGDAEARTLQADIYEHQERYEEAERVARAVLAENPAHADAWDVLVDVYRAQARWRELETAATHVIEPCKARGNKPVLALCERACARIELGDFVSAAADLEELSRLKVRDGASAAASVRALLLLRTGQYKEALRIAQERLHRGAMPWCGVLVAVRFEAAHRLSRPQEAGTVSASAAKLLRRHGHGTWVDRLVADYGLRIWRSTGV
jgi:tetratricopeptide (TPR) repeat protein